MLNKYTCYKKLRLCENTIGNQKCLAHDCLQPFDCDGVFFSGHSTPWLTNVTGCSDPQPWSEPSNASRVWTPGNDSLFYQRNRTHRFFDDYYMGTYTHPGFGRIIVTFRAGVLQFTYQKVRN